MNFIKQYIDYAKNNPQGYWFKRRMYGWGWTPVAWQGWLLTFGFVGLIIWNATRLDSIAHSASDALMNVVPQTFALIILFIVVAWRTGEPPKWL